MLSSVGDFFAINAQGCFKAMFTGSLCYLVIGALRFALHL
jgi:hypothetical protein